MRKAFVSLVAATLIGFCCSLSVVADDSRWGQPIVEAVPTPSPPSIGSPSFILVDIKSGNIIAKRDPHEQWEPASLAKMMTAYVVFRELSAGHIDLEDRVTISERAWRSQGSRMFVEVGEQVSVKKLLQGLIIQSGNDAAVALAEHVAGDEDTFAQVMNQEAQRLGMENTQYANSTGMPNAEMYTTAFDTARLARAIIEEHPEFYNWYSQRSFEYAGIVQHNRNRLLWRDESVDGLKTGYTSSAGYNLTTSAERAEMRLISVVLGADSEDARAQQSHQLLNYGFRFFETHRLYSAQERLSEARTWKADKESLELGIAEDLYVTIPRRERDNLSASVRLHDELIAPITQGEEIGEVDIVLAGEVIHTEPLIALNDLEEGGLWRRLVDSLWLRFQ
ncbi:D-alanyl-D-alanine carboxypeptidase [Halorhodospira halochloris]|uniref:serine-type D-Ala-D-Ala carboxypeptidase n=1 Tax=Halorhodospira halochloris TaxID=1052 RepID=A0A0X8XAW6_HALHR|nr:D-alanyl-D-alanine carboxypeptidase family protein [Halorhodospira halochloris]MBK1650991.1 serine-type D-Ala-D-Ala carboxypeptidase [Halorhodospira halochloris]MCG5547333.1 D-alanyl-D-alanine carboxypeptidase [Halorhodospira halochloris]BAU56499.1 D-alanyl-D-alanine carboxypeptidase [Halorhodospira halochloris]